MNQHRTNLLTITTPEGVAFSLLLAGPVSRFLSWLLDLMCIMAIFMTAGKLIQIGAFISEDFASAVMILTFFVITTGYGIVLEWAWRGQTLGKRLFHMRVMDARGMNLQFSQIVIRNLLRCVDSLPLFYMTGGLACLISRRGQRLGDIAANTIVVRHPRVSEPDLDQLLEEIKFNSFREYPHLEARLRQRVSPDEAGLALRALMRRDELDPLARVELFQEMAEHFKKTVEFPLEAVEGISDEQYIRNVVEAIFRPKTNEKAGR